jgi:hypothetical protein
MRQNQSVTPSAVEHQRSESVIRPAGPAISGLHFAIGLCGIAALAAVPFLVGSLVSANRVARARNDVSQIAAALRGPSRLPTGERGVLVGRGKLPLGDKNSPWFQGSLESLDRELAARGIVVSTTDPWLQPYLVNVGAIRGRWVISAGANGILETPFDDAFAPKGDDVAAALP